MKSEGPPVAGGVLSEIRFSEIKLYPNEAILDADYNDFRLRFQLCPPQVLNPSTGVEDLPRFCQNLAIFKNIDFLESSYMTSRGIKYDWWSLLIPEEASIRVLVHFQDH